MRKEREEGEKELSEKLQNEKRIKHQETLKKIKQKGEDRKLLMKAQNKEYQDMASKPDSTRNMDTSTR